MRINKFMNRLYNASNYSSTGFSGMSKFCSYQSVAIKVLYNTVITHCRLPEYWLLYTLKRLTSKYVDGYMVITCRNDTEIAAIKYRYMHVQGIRQHNFSSKYYHSENKKGYCRSSKNSLPCPKNFQEEAPFYRACPLKPLQ